MPDRLSDWETAFKMSDKVVRELRRQHDMWGEQSHPLIHPSRLEDIFFYRNCESYWKFDNERRVDRGTLGWDGILLEEVYEALSAPLPDDQVTELVQVAAVALNAAMSIQRAQGAAA